MLLLLYCTLSIYIFIFMIWCLKQCLAWEEAFYRSNYIFMNFVHPFSCSLTPSWQTYGRAVHRLRTRCIPSRCLWRLITGQHLQDLNVQPRRPRPAPSPTPAGLHFSLGCCFCVLWDLRAVYTTTFSGENTKKLCFVFVWLHENNILRRARNIEMSSVSMETLESLSPWQRYAH